MTTYPNPPCDVGVILATPCESSCDPHAAPWILTATVLASSMAFIDGTVVNVALPTIQKELNASIADAQWVIEAYALLLAALLLVGGTAGDRYGRRRIFLLGVTLFGITSIWCGLAGSIRELVLARAGQGIGGALMIPSSLAIVGASFAEGDRGKVIGTWSGATAIIAALGTVLGGWLIDHLSWRAAFLLNVPLAAVVLAVTLLYVPESKNLRTPGRLDWLGVLLATLGLGGVVYGLIEASNKGWANPDILAALSLGTVLLVCFVMVQIYKTAPMIPLSLFRSRTFFGANLLTLLLYAALGGGLFFVPLNLIQIYNYSATAAGAALLPFLLLVFLFSRWSGSVIALCGAKVLLVTGPLVAAIGFAMFAVLPDGGSYWTTFFPAILVLGIGNSVSVVPLTTIVMSSVNPAFEGTASGINNAAARIGVVIAIALFGVFFAQIFNHRLDENLKRANLPPVIFQSVEQQRSKLAAIKLPEYIEDSVKAAAQTAIADAFVRSFQRTMILSAMLALASAAIAWMLIESASGTPQKNNPQ